MKNEISRIIGSKDYVFESNGKLIEERVNNLFSKSVTWCKLKPLLRYKKISLRINLT